MWQDWYSNLVLKNVEKSIFATALSVQNIPGFLLVGGMSYVFNRLPKGYPDLTEMFSILICLPLIADLTMLMFNREKYA